MSSVFCIIQARLGSTRLPTKVLKSVGNKLLVEHVLNRCLDAFPANEIVIATTDLNEDDPLVSFLQKKYNVHIYRGDSLDVRSRFTTIARQFDLSGLVRVTADDPFKDPAHLIEARNYIEKLGYDYFNNFEYQAFPTGFDTESVLSPILYRNEIIDGSNLSKEHVTWGIRQDQKIKKFYVSSPPIYQNLRFTIDTQDDLEFCSAVAALLERTHPGNYDYRVTISAALEVLKNWRLS